MKKLFVIIIFIFIILSGCASAAKIEIEGNGSVGDNWISEITPEGFVREASSKYKIAMPLPGMGGKFIFKFEAVSEGEAGVVLSHYFRGGFRNAIIYDAVVDNRKKLTVTIRMYEPGNKNRIVKSYDPFIYAKIINDFTEAIEEKLNDEYGLDSYDSYLYSNRGHYYFLSGDYEKAAKDFETAILLDPENNDAAEYLELLYK